MDRTLALRVAARFQQRSAGQGDGKLVAQGCRLRWSDGQWQLEELPAKGKRKLRVCTLSNPYYIVRSQNLIPDNVLRSAGLSKSDSYEAIKKKLETAMLEAAAADVKSGKAPKWVDSDRSGIKWYENEVYFLEVVPEDVHPFKVEGKDFTLDVAWTDFKAYSPDSDMQLSDPHYTIIQQKSPGAARKLYTTLTADPKALKSVSWSEFTKWLDTKKIGYDMRFSQWT